MPEEQKNPLGFGCQVKSCQNKRKKTNGEKEGSVKRSNKSLTILTMPKKKVTRALLSMAAAEWEKVQN